MSKNPVYKKLCGTVKVCIDKYFVEADVIAYVIEDKFYGADADGNRAMTGYFFEDAEIVDEPLVISEDSDEYIPFKSLPKETQDKILDEIYKKIELVDLEPCEDYDHDYDDM